MDVSPVMLIGECNPYQDATPDDHFSLYPEPRGAAGERLMNILGVPRHVYMSLRRRNLCFGQWTMQAARRRVSEIVLLDTTVEVAVLLGKKVQAAFGFDVEPFALRSEPRRLIRGDIKYVILPHPSGRNLVWNQPGSRESARRLMREAAPEINWGEAP